MMTRHLINSGSQFEHDIGDSRAVVDGEWIFVSGTTGFNYDTIGQPAGADRPVPEEHSAVLKQAGTDCADVVRVMYIVPDTARFPDCWPVLRQYVRPAATMMSAELSDPRMQIEIQVTARKRLP